MAYDPDNPKVKAAKEFCERFGFEKVIIVGLNETDRTIAGTSYGVTKQKCSEAKSQMNTAYDAVYKSYLED